MSKFDKVLHIVGAGAAGLLITALSGGIALPAAVKIVCVAVAYATGATAGSVFGSKPSDPPAK